MLTILNDPAGITGAQRFELLPGEPLQAQIARRMPHGAGGCRLLIDGIEVDPLTDPRMDAPPRPGMLVTIEQRPEGVETWILVASFVLSAYSYSLIPRNPGQQQVSESPNNSLTAQTNIARAYQAIPDVYGYRRVWPDLIQPSTVEYQGNVKLVTEWLCVSRGKGTIEAVQYADTPIGDIAGASSEVFDPSASPSAYPELNDTTLTEVFETFASPEVDGQELADSSAAIFATGTLDCASGSPTFSIEFPASSALAALDGPASAVVTCDLPDQLPLNDETCTIVSYVDGGSTITVTFTRPINFAVTNTYTFLPVRMVPTGGGSAIGPFTLPVECERIWFNLKFPRGLVGVVNIGWEWWAIDAADAEIPGTRQSDDQDFNANTYDEQNFTIKILPASGTARYRIEFTRRTSDLGNGADVAKLVELYAVRYYPTKVLPGVTVARITTRATTQATGFRERKFNLRWTRHVRTLSSTTLSASRNFARAMAHLWCVAGEDLAELDTTALAAVNTGIGETSPLLRFDGSLDEADMSLGERLQVIANAARCVVWRDGTKWTVTRDQLRATPELQLDYRNLARGGESAISYAAHLPASFDGVELEYVDEEAQQQKATVRLSIASGAVVVGTSGRPQKIKLTGCATELQALNRAQLEARKLLYQRTSVKDTALADAAALGIGALVRWVDPNDFAGDDDLQAGEIIAVDGSSVTTSEALDWKSESSGRMLITGDDGYYTGAPIVVTPATGGALLASVPAGLYVRDDDRQLGSRYAFSVGLTQAEMEAAGLFLVTEIRPGQDRTVSLAMVNYDARVYAYDGSAPVGVATERDYAFALTSPQSTVGMATETDTAFALTSPLGVGMASETDTALAPPSTWNPSDKDADVTLSGANKVASVTTANGAVRGIQSRNASDDRCFMIDYVGGDGRTCPGIAKASAGLTTCPGEDADGFGWFGFNATLQNAGATSYGATLTGNAKILVRLHSGSLTFYLWNGSAWSSQGTATTGLTGDWFPCWGPASAAGGTRSATLDTDGSSWPAAAPAGVAWG